MANAKDMDGLLKRFVDGGLSGCGCKVVQRGKTLYEGYYGYSDKEAGKELDKTGIFRMASMSKIPMYTVCMMLYERGAFNLTDPVSAYLPEWEDLQKYVTMPNGDVKAVPCEKKLKVGDIFSMKCGLPYCNGAAPTNNPTLASMQECMKPLWEKGHYTNKEQVSAMSKAVLACEPGERWIYGFSSEISVALIEKVCGKGVDEVMQEFLFDPLEMKDTASRYFGDTQSRMVKMYTVGANNTPHFDPCALDEKHLPGPEHEQGWARLFSTVEDYSHLMSMLAEGGIYNGKKIMGRRTIDMMRSNGLSAEQLKSYTTMYEAGYGYGYGVRTLVDRAAGNHPGSLGSFGWTGGFGTWCEADPEDGVSIVYMHNQIPNMEEYYHHLVRQVAYGLAE